MVRLYIPRLGGQSLRALHLAALGVAWLAASCSRQLPTAPSLDPAAIGPDRTADARIEDETAVTLAPGADAVRVGSDYGATLVWSGDWGCAAYLPRTGETPLELAVRMRGDPRVVTAEGNGYLEPAEVRQRSWAFDDGFGSLSSYKEQPAAQSLNLAAAHQVTLGENVRVAILDTGAELAHPALQGRVVGGWDFVQGDADPGEAGDGADNDGDGLVDEAIGHGTHVAGIVTLTAPRAQLLIVRVLDGDGRGDLLTVASGVRWALDHGARVINLSLGSLTKSDAIQYALEEAEQAGVVVLASAGNWGADKPEEYPAKSSHALAVAAVDAGGRAADFTSFGGFVALSAPGVGVRSAFPGGRYLIWSGTSMSAPFVSGAAALLLSLHPGWNAELVLNRLAATARPVTASNPEARDKLGAGALDVGGALAPDRPSGILPEGQEAEPLPGRRP